MIFNTPIRPLIAALGLCASATSEASVVISINANLLTDAYGAPIPAGSLLQLVNLGADGVFNPISLADGSSGTLTQWVSGDDTLINVPFADSNNHGIDFPSAAAFDLFFGTDNFPGRLIRSMEFESGLVSFGTKVGLRWFPLIQANDFATTTLGPTNMRYGEFTRQSPDPLQHALTDYWTFPANGQSFSFDALQTNSAGGNDANVKGQAIHGTPEPASVSLVLAGAAGLLGLRRRREPLLH